MGTMALLVCLVAGDTPPRIPGDLLLLDSAVSGLLDAYLEAVPECPAREDTPVRQWLLDLAGTRAGASLRDASTLIRRSRSDCLRFRLKHYLWACKACLDTFSELRNMYRPGAIPDSAACIAAESELIAADGAWLEAGLSLFGLLAEEGWR